MPLRTLRMPLTVFLLLIIAAGCGPAPLPSAPSAGTTEPDDAAVDTPSPTVSYVIEQPTPLPEYDAAPLPDDIGRLFSASGACADCHTGMKDRAGSDVSMGVDWPGAIMANASRDPYWQASVRSEVLDHPGLTAVIEDKCATCHTPMARFTAASAGNDSPLLDGGFLSDDHPDHGLAIDGVSCAVCHQIEQQGFGEPDSFSGGYVIDLELPTGQRLAYGPFRPARIPASVMQDVSGFRPVRGPHAGEAELCATCHTLYTPYVDENGEVAGTFPEQVPYLEWQHSDHAETESCQDCHMPPTDSPVRLASMGGGPPRSPFAQHRFIGGNTYILKMLWALGEDLNVTASSDHFARKVAQTLEQLQERTATLSVGQADVRESRLSFDVVVRSLAGHKVPTGFPSRRAWLHVIVEDEVGNVVFESGAFGPDGAIAGNDNDADAAAYEPHYEMITDPSQVQIYEPILEDVSGGVTTALLEAKGYRKDNRLLPQGFDKASAGADFAVYGAAVDDTDFAAPGDTVRYAVELPEAPGSLSVRVELLYQSIGYRWTENLRGQNAPEIAQFVNAYDDLPNLPVIVAEASLTVEP